MTKQPGLLRLLNDASSPYRDPLARLHWEGLDLDRWWLPPHALSLSGVEDFENLSPALRRRLSHCEYLHLMEAGLWLKSLFMRQVCGALDGSTAALQSRYLHEIREKAGHSLMFLELTERSGIRIPDLHRHRPRFSASLSRRVNIDSALFWALAVIGEELPDKLNRAVRQMSDSVPVCTVVYHLATLQVMDETRHIALARANCEDVSQRLSRWQRLVQSPVLSWFLRALARYLFFPPPVVYEAAGFERPCAWRELAKANPGRRRLVEHAVKPTLEFLRDQGWCVRGLNG
jgi:P-aminobenzoate N-oxygenase AurF